MSASSWTSYRTAAHCSAHISPPHEVVSALVYPLRAEAEPTLYTTQMPTELARAHALSRLEHARCGGDHTSGGSLNVRSYGLHVTCACTCDMHMHRYGAPKSETVVGSL
eukprot:911297-Prymnesium_polylepis.2